MIVLNIGNHLYLDGICYTEYFLMRKYEQLIRRLFYESQNFDSNDTESRFSCLVIENVEEGN